jgi:hypothetical protein
MSSSSAAIAPAATSKQMLSIDFRSFLLPNIHMNFDSYTYASSNNVCKEFTIYNKKVDKHIHAMVSILYDEDEDCRTHKLVAFNESKNKYDLFEVACIVRHLPSVFGLDVNNALSGINLLMVDLLHDESTSTTIQQPNILDDDDIQKDHKLMYDDMDKYVLQPLTFPRDSLPRDSLPRDSLPRDSLPRDSLPRDTRVCPSQKPIHIKSKNKEKFRKLFEDSIREDNESDQLALSRMDKLVRGEI